MRVLLLEDDRETATALVSGLRAAGYEPIAAYDVPSAAALVEAHAFDAAVLDLVVPGGSGYDVLELLRRRTPGLPVLVLTARDSVESRVEGLNRGADDYLVKPFSFSELLARLRSILRRPRQIVERMTVANLEIDPLQRIASVEGNALDLSTKEFELLRFLVEEPGQVRSRAALLERVWGIRFDPGTNVIDVHVSRLRSKLRLAGAKVSIHARRGIGYVVE